MNIFYGAAIQGAPTRGMRVTINSKIIKTIASCGHKVVAEPTAGRTSEEVADLLSADFGRLPPKGIERTRYTRLKMIECVERPDLDAAIFEVSLPSTGTGIELAHTYLRPRLGLSEIPILLLYETDYWVNGLSSMVKGLPFDKMPNIRLIEYKNTTALAKAVEKFLKMLEDV